MGLDLESLFTRLLSVRVKKDLVFDCIWSYFSRVITI